MISKISISNFRSINEKVTLNFNFPINRANSFKQNIIYQYKDDGVRCILNGLILFGANAAGKSNVLKGIKEMRKYIIDSHKFDDLNEIYSKIDSFKFNNSSNETTFEIELVIKDIIADDDEGDFIINYSFSINSESQTISEEKLIYKKILVTKVSEERLIFYRKHNEVVDNTRTLNKILNKVEQENITHKLLISMIIFEINEAFFEEETTSIDYAICQRLMGFINANLIFEEESFTSTFSSEINNNMEFKKYILENLKSFDFAIKDFEVVDATSELINSLKNANIEFSDKNKLINDIERMRHFNTYTIHNVNGKDVRLGLEDESDGTIKFLNVSFSMYRSLLYNGIFICDEIEKNYHYRIQEGIINNFINQYGNAQFLLTTHNPLLLNKELFAKEQIIFVEKRRDFESTNIYSLSDFNVSYNNHNWFNLYTDGRFGSVPEVLY
ncbi:AAA family ATPase [Macrococcoides caseolyticum]|uniref:AAA family ATPase n=1 Tax=Macrococcoides caseolyticum TaxID=69966 RepID=UPI0012FEE1E7|nr:ATP-binding protein [Macrococcus caseolyticus]